MRIDSHDEERLIAFAPVMSAAVSELTRLAAENVPTLVCGESGVGVGWLCRWVHEKAPRRGPLEVVNPAAQAASQHEAALFGELGGGGALGRAAGGTLLIRNFGELEPELQRRVVENAERHRTVATCYGDLQRAMKQCSDDAVLAFFRGRVEVPPLRFRRDDIGALAQYFWTRFADANRWNAPDLTPAQLDQLRAYEWPGNVRELHNALVVTMHDWHRGNPVRIPVG